MPACPARLRGRAWARTSCGSPAAARGPHVLLDIVARLHKVVSHRRQRAAQHGRWPRDLSTRWHALLRPSLGPRKRRGSRVRSWSQRTVLLITSARPSSSASLAKRTGRIPSRAAIRLLVVGASERASRSPWVSATEERLNWPGEPETEFHLRYGEPKAAADSSAGVALKSGPPRSRVHWSSPRPAIRGAAPWQRGSGASTPRSRAHPECPSRSVHRWQPAMDRGRSRIRSIAFPC